MMDAATTGPDAGAPRTRNYRPEDLDRIVQLWNEWTAPHQDTVHRLADVVAACESGLGVVAVASGRVIGAVVARAERDTAEVLLFAQDKDHRHRGVGSALLTALEKRALDRGATTITVLVPATEDRLLAFHNSGFTNATEMVHLERHLTVNPHELDILNRLGGQMLDHGLWDALAGMHREKELIDARLVLPLAQAGLASEFGVVAPRAAVLFGPPGTGKTTFARAIASQLGWPFIELRPSRLAAEPAGLAASLRQAFVDIGEMAHAVVFIDEVEEIASHRSGDPPSPNQAVTNELLKCIPAFKQRDGRLLLCATNFIRSLDRAFLRHGRFDYIIPIGLPDADARSAIWARYLPPGVPVDARELADMSEGFSPADIEYAARRASQAAFETAVRSRDGRRAPEVLDRDLYRHAIAETTPSTSSAMIAEFGADITALART